MKRYTQTVDDLKSNLSTLESDWKDPFAEKVINLLEFIDHHKEFDEKLLTELLKRDYEATITIIRLFLEKSKDEFYSILKQQVFNDKKRVGKKLFLDDPMFFVRRLAQLNIISHVNDTINKSYT